jgi:hypothetical protein
VLSNLPQDEMQAGSPAHEEGAFCASACEIGAPISTATNIKGVKRDFCFMHHSTAKQIVTCSRACG